MMTLKGLLLAFFVGFELTFMSGFGVSAVHGFPDTQVRHQTSVYTVNRIQHLDEKFRSCCHLVRWSVRQKTSVLL